MKAAVSPVKSNSLVERIADAVLYEGYMLYPYRPSAVKNQQRWNFGALCPGSYATAQRGTESSRMQTQCLVQVGAGALLDVKVRFLHLLLREVGEIVLECGKDIPECGHLQVDTGEHVRLVPSIEVNGRILQTWQEAVEREVLITSIAIGKLETEVKHLEFSFPESKTFESLIDESTGQSVGLVVRRQKAIDGVIEVSYSDNSLSNQPLRLTVVISNSTHFADAENRSRDEALMSSFVSTHTILNLHKGEFISLLDPPEDYKAAASECSNIGTYPVLVGEEGERDCMLSSPIILYDYPQIAPESAGNLYDGTEIDEILTLRIMTLTEEEKREMRGADDRARQILERTEMLPQEQLMKLHGAMKSVGRSEK